MKRAWLPVLLVGVAAGVVSPGLAQVPTGGRKPPTTPSTGVTPEGEEKKKDKDRHEPPAVLLNDTKFKQVYVDFVQKSEKLADEFERTKQHDKAKAVYEEKLRLVPEYANAKKKLEDIKTQEAIADKKIVEIHANKDWQDTGVVVVAGKPVHITSSGNWTFTLSREITADGIAIPKELRDFNLGALVGFIQTADPKDMKPFFVGADKGFTADKTGKLLLRMYDDDPRDNKGKITVTIQGTFEKARP